MGDITKAGSNRGDLERELEDILRFAKMTYQRYVLTIEDYTREELEGDLEEYTLQLENFVAPLLERAEEEGYEDIAKEIEGYYKRLIDAIKQRLLEI
jgi:thymidylate synthase ThyX